MAKIEAVLMDEVVFSNSKEAMELFDKRRFGEKDKGKIVYMLEEAMYLVETGKMVVLNSSYKEMSREDFLKKLQKITKRFMVRYAVYKDLKDKGYTPKSALKFGSDFRVYDKGVKVGKGHSEWVCFAEHEHATFSAQDFSSKNRVAHSTKKNLLLAVVDSEGSVSYYETSWKKVI